MAEGLEEVVIDDDIAEDALVVAVELRSCQQRSSLSVRLAVIILTMSTVDAATEIHTVRASPEPPRYLRPMATGVRTKKTGTQRKVQKL